MAGNPIANLLGKVNANNALVVSLDGGAIAGSLVTVTQTALGTTPAPGVIVQNTTSAAAGAQQISPATDWVGQGWKTDATAASQEVRFRADVLPVEGAAAPTGNWRLGVKINSGAVSYPLIITSAGQLLGLDGTAALPARTYASEPSLGAYRIGSGFEGFAAGGGGIFGYASSGIIQMVSTASLEWSSGALNAASDTKLSRGAANRLDLATGDSFYVIAGGIGAGIAPTATAFLTTGVGTNAIAPLVITNGANLTSAVANAIENDGAAFYHTMDTTNGRRYWDGWNYFNLTGSGTGITTIADFFGATGSGIPLVANGFYEIEWYCYFSQATAGTATWTIVTATTALATLTGEYVGSPVAGIGAVGTPQTAGINVATSSSQAFPVSGTEADAATHRFAIRVKVKAGNGASNTRLRLAMSAGTATPLVNSYFRVRRLSGANVGTFAT